MGLIIKSKSGKNSKKIVLTGTDVELKEVYGRVTFAGHADGKTLECSIVTYASKKAFGTEGATPVNTSIFSKASASVKHELGKDEVQGIDAALSLAKKAISELGYDVTTD